MTTLSQEKLLLPRTALVPGEPSRYGGTVFRGLVAVSDDRTLRIYQVVFAPRSRTAWHVHSGQQILLTLAGRIVVAIEGRAPQVLPEGGAVRIPPGTRHWHGAMPSAEAAHLAVNVACTTEWLGPVSDLDYDRAVG